MNSSQMARPATVSVTQVEAWPISTKPRPLLSFFR